MASGRLARFRLPRHANSIAYRANGFIDDEAEEYSEEEDEESE